MEKKKFKLSLTWQIVIGLVLGIIAGFVLQLIKMPEIANDYIKPIGTIYLNLIKMIVVPVVTLSIIQGVISLQDIRKVGTIGGRTVAYFLCTTAFAVVIGLVFANLLNVGGGIADNIADTVGRICDIVIMISVLNGVSNLAERLHNEKLAELAGKLMNTLIVIIGLSAVATVIPAFFGVNEVFMNISSIMNMVAGGLAIIGTIIYLVFLGKGMKMLKEN